MTDQFDPYYNWLAIPKHESANGGPDHYRLLGVPRYEENPDVISNAADQRSHYLRTLQTGKHSSESQRLLNEVAAAAGCLLNPERKAAYDRQLRAQDAVRTPTSVTVKPIVVSHAPATALMPAPQATRQIPTEKPAAEPRPNARLVTAAIVLPVLLALVVVVVLSLNSGGDSPSNQAAVVPPSIDPVPPSSPSSSAPVSEAPTEPATPAAPTPASSPPTPPSTPPGVAESPGAPAEIVPPTSPGGKPTATGSPKFDPVHGLDLLPAAATDLRLIRGDAKFEGQVLSIPNQSTAFTLPADFPDEYVLEADVTRESGTNSICFGIPVHGRPLTAVIDGFFSTKSGLACVDNREIYTEGNPLVRGGRVLTNGKQATVRIEVTADAVRLSADGNLIVNWDWDPQAKLRSAQGMQAGDLTRLHVFTWDAAYRISRLQLLPVD